MNVDALMTRDVKTCRPSDTLKTAAFVMWDADCGFVPVLTEWGRIVGVITDRDICMAAVLEDRRLDDIRVEKTMSRDVHSCRPNDPIEAAERLMETHRVRRVPVIDDAGQLVGVVTLSDIAREARRERSARLIRAVSDELLVDTLAAVCEPRGSSPAIAAG